MSPLEERLQEAEMQCRFERAVPLVNDAGLSLDPREFQRPLAKPSPVVDIMSATASTEGQDKPQSRGGMDVKSVCRDGMLELEVSLDVAGRKTPIAVLTCLDSLTGHSAAIAIANAATMALVERHPAVTPDGNPTSEAP